MFMSAVEAKKQADANRPAVEAECLKLQREYLIREIAHAVERGETSLTDQGGYQPSIYAELRAAGYVVSEAGRTVSIGWEDPEQHAKDLAEMRDSFEKYGQWPAPASN